MSSRVSETLLVNARTVLVYLLCSAWRVFVATMKKLRRCCCFWAPREDQYKLVASGSGRAGGQELITIRPKVMYSAVGEHMGGMECGREI